MFNQTLFDAILGQTSSISSVQTYGTIGLEYYNKWSVAIEDQWAVHGDGSIYPVAFGEALTAVHQYDRVYQYYAWYKMSGYTNTTYRDRARLTALNYLAYLIPAGASNPYYNEMKGVGLYYADTGDATALAALGVDANVYSSAWVPFIPTGGPGAGAPIPPATRLYGEGIHEIRPWVRSTECMIIASLASAPSSGGYNYTALAAQCVDRLLNCQYPDGSWRASASRRDPGPQAIIDGVLQYIGQDQLYPWYISAFYNGLAMSVLMLYYESVFADPRIPTAVKNCVDFLFDPANFVWSPAAEDIFGRGNSMNYLDHSTYLEQFPPYAPNPGDVWPRAGAPDLNGLIVPGVAFAYSTTGTTLYRTRANLMLQSTLDYGDFSTFGRAGKRFNENFSFSWKAFPLLLGTTSVNNTIAATEVRDGASIVGRIGTSIRLNWV